MPTLPTQQEYKLLKKLTLIYFEVFDPVGTLIIKKSSMLIKPFDNHYKWMKSLMLKKACVFIFSEEMKVAEVSVENYFNLIFCLNLLIWLYM